MSTFVDRPFSEVSHDFDQKLFEYLAPPPFIATVEQYEGSEIGDKVIMKFHLPKGRWVSEIEDREVFQDEVRFTDRGRELPFPIKTWYHIHRIKKCEGGSLILDEMHFSARILLLSPFLYLGIAAGFYPRKWLYKRYFEHENSRDRSGVGRKAAG